MDNHFNYSVAKEKHLHTGHAINMGEYPNVVIFWLVWYAAIFWLLWNVAANWWRGAGWILQTTPAFPSTEVFLETKVQRCGAGDNPLRPCLWQYNWSIWLHFQYFKLQLRLHAALRRRGLMERASEVGLEIYIIRREAIVVAHLRWAGWVCTTGGGTTATTSTSCTTSPCLDQTSSYVPCSILAKNFLD